MNNKFNVSDKSITDVHEMIIASMEYAKSKAKQYHNKYGLPLDECVSKGYLALCEAARNYDAEKNSSFVGYASLYIKGGLRKLSDMNLRTQSLCTFDDSLLNRDVCAYADEEIKYHDLVDLIRGYVEGHYYPEAAQDYLDVLNLIASGYKPGEAAEKCNMDMHIFKWVNNEVSSYLHHCHYY